VGNAWERRSQALNFCNAAFPGLARACFSGNARFAYSQEEDSLKAAIAIEMQQQYAETSTDDHGFHVAV